MTKFYIEERRGGAAYWLTDGQGQADAQYHYYYHYDPTGSVIARSELLKKSIVTMFMAIRTAQAVLAIPTTMPCLLLNMSLRNSKMSLAKIFKVDFS